MAEPPPPRAGSRRQTIPRLVVLPLFADLRATLRDQLKPRAPKSAGRELSVGTASTLRATAEALLGSTVTDFEPYVAHLQWRALHLPGAADVIDAFAASMRQAADARYGRPFEVCDASQRLALLPTPPPQGGNGVRRVLRLIERRIRDAEEALAYSQVILPVLRLFAATDAWLAVGYRQHPGTTRAFPTTDEPGLVHGGA